MCSICDAIANGQSEEEALEAHFKKHRENIENFGITVVGVFGDDASWVYGAGMYRVKQPDVVTTNLNARVAAACLNHIYDKVAKEGWTIPLDERVEGILSDGYQPVFKLLPNDAAEKYCPASFGHALVDGAQTTIVQMVWPDDENRLPWEKGYNDKFVQPLLFTGGAAPNLS